MTLPIIQTTAHGITLPYELPADATTRVAISGPAAAEYLKTLKGNKVVTIVIERPELLSFDCLGAHLPSLKATLEELGYDATEVITELTITGGGSIPLTPDEVGELAEKHWNDENHVGRVLVGFHANEVNLSGTGARFEKGGIWFDLQLTVPIADKAEENL